MLREMERTNTYAVDQAAYFRLMAEMDYTKHLGGIAATRQLATLCGLKAEELVLDVGCGVGISPVLLARRYDCRVMGVDLLPALVARAALRARREQMADRITFQVADARFLPYDDDLFDAVIAESVLSFLPDPAQALAEMMRVTRPGGHVAFTEGIWMQPPSPEMADFMTGTAGLPAGLLDHEEWLALMQRTGLEQVTGRAHAISARSEARDQLGRLGLENYVRLIARSIPVIFKPEYRFLLTEGRRQPVPKYFSYIGYGVYAGLKARQG